MPPSVARAPGAAFVQGSGAARAIAPRHRPGRRHRRRPPAPAISPRSDCPHRWPASPCRARARARCDTADLAGALQPLWPRPPGRALSWPKRAQKSIRASKALKRASKMACDVVLFRGGEGGRWTPVITCEEKDPTRGARAARSASGAAPPPGGSALLVRDVRRLAPRARSVGGLRTRAGSGRRRDMP